jgi:glycerol-3-phosphate acyltransferase PlsY
MAYLDFGAVFPYVGKESSLTITGSRVTEIAVLLPAVLLGYLLGSIPTAYILVLLRKRVDIRRAGSGNVGALNTYEVTGSRLLGAAVMVVDAVKGAAAVVLGGPPAGAAAVVGHCYPVWLRFHGGRGLATAAGMVLVIAWPYLAGWLVFWGLGYLVIREVNGGNMIATLLTAALVAVGVPGAPLERVAAVSILVSLAVITARLVHPVAELVKHRRTTDKDRS